MTSLDKLLAKRVPDALKQLAVARRLPHPDGIPRARKIDVEHVLDPPWTRGKQDDPVGERERFTEIVGYKEDRLLFALPDAQQHLMHVDLGMGIERAEW